MLLHGRQTRRLREFFGVVLLKYGDIITEKPKRLVNRARAGQNGILETSRAPVGARRLNFGYSSSRQAMHRQLSDPRLGGTA